MAIYDTNNHICRQTKGFSFVFVMYFANQLICSDLIALFGAIFISYELESRLHEIRSVGIILFDDPLVAESFLSIGEVLLGVNDVLIEVRVVVVEGVLSNVVPFSSRLRSTHDELVVVHGLGNADSVLSTNHIGIRSVVGNEVIEVVAE